MAKYKAYSYAQGAFIPVHFSHQIQPGTFDSRFNNIDTGAPAYAPKLLLKIVLFAYSRGITSAGRSPRPARRT